MYDQKKRIKSFIIYNIVAAHIWNDYTIMISLNCFLYIVLYGWHGDTETVIHEFRIVYL